MIWTNAACKASTCWHSPPRTSKSIEEDFSKEVHNHYMEAKATDFDMSNNVFKVIPSYFGVQIVGAVPYTLNPKLPNDARLKRKGRYLSGRWQRASISCLKPGRNDCCQLSYG